MMQKKQLVTMIRILKMNKLIVFFTTCLLLTIIYFSSCAIKKQREDYIQNSYVLSEYLWEDTLKAFSHTCYFRVKSNDLICEAEILVKDKKIKNSNINKYIIKDSKVFRVFGDSINLHKSEYLSYSRKNECLDFTFPDKYAQSVINKPFTICYLGTKNIQYNDKDIALFIFQFEENIIDGQYYRVNYFKDLIPYEIRFNSFSPVQRKVLEPINILSIIDQEYIDIAFKKLNKEMDNLLINFPAVPSLPKKQ